MYRGAQYPSQYWQLAQRQQFPGAMPQWGFGNRWARWRRRYPYRRYGNDASAYAQPSYNDEPMYAEPPYEEPPMPPPVIVAAPPPSPPPMPEPPPGSTEEPPTSTPPAQGQAPTEEFFIEAEAFEFEPELDEYENGWGELEGGAEQYETGFDEFEGEAPTMACPPYQRGEVEKSRTAQGHLPSDVIQHSRGLLIADFGVDWRTPKPSLRGDATLQNWVNTMVQLVRANPNTRIRISGYSDCIGRENNNAFLRRGRAQRILQLLQQVAGAQWGVLRPKIVFTGAAPAGDYVADNSNVNGRAQNRSVLIEHTRKIDFAPGEGTVIQGRDTIERICRRGTELIQSLDRFGSRITRHQQQRIRCFISRLCQQGFDDRYLTAQGVLDYTNRVYSQPYYASAKQWLLPDFIVKSGQQRSDQDIWQTLIRIDDDIIQGRAKINYFYHTHGAATPVRVQQLRDWVAQQERSNRSIYLCYGTRAP
jgi:outer membrane protein OmpA-like peptidoglycan-associated protein